MPNEAAMNWYKQEEGKQALSKLETLLAQKTLTEIDDFEGPVSDVVYGLLTRLPEEKRPVFAYLANMLLDYYNECMLKPCALGPVQIAERAALILRQDKLQKMYEQYFPDQPCV